MSLKSLDLDTRSSAGMVSFPFWINKSLLPSGGGRRAKPARRVFFFEKEKEGGGKVENLLLVFHFSIRLAAGAVEMWESRLSLARFPRGGGKGGKPAFGFPRFPPSRHFHSSLRFSSPCLRQ
jgi:hypothetical protein